MYDIIIIGAGPGGYVAAIRSAQLGLKTAIIEEKELGGVCLNWGCIPSKALLNSAHVCHVIHDAKSFGVDIPDYNINFQSMIQRSRDISKRLSQGIDFLMKKNKIDLIKGRAKFKTAQEIDVAEKTYKAKNFIVATGAQARLLPEVTISDRIWTSKEAMFPKKLLWDRPPKNLLVIGSGAIGMEFASFYNAVGTKVTVVELLDRILPQEDKEISDFALKSFEKQGIDFKIKCKTNDLKEEKDGVVVIFDQGPNQKFDAVLIAIGIVPNTKDLGLEKLSIELEKGHIKIDGHNKTNVENIYAIGDVVAPPWLAHKASYEGICVAETIAGFYHKPFDPAQVPNCTYCMPQVASIGLTEVQAREKGYTIKVGRFNNNANGKSLAIGQENGLVKTIFDQKTGAFLGAHMIGPEVTEMIALFALALKLEATEEEFFETIFPHPTLSEMIQESCLDAFSRSIHKPS